MKKLITGLAAVLAFGFYGSVNSAKSIEIEVAYPYSGLFDVTFQAIMPEFEKAHPDIQVKFLWGYDEPLFTAAQFSFDPPPFEK